MVPHCSILTWKTRWAEEPVGLQSMGLQRVRHDWSNKHTWLYSYFGQWNVRKYCIRNLIEKEYLLPTDRKQVWQLKFEQSYQTIEKSYRHLDLCVLSTQLIPSPVWASVISPHRFPRSYNLISYTWFIQLSSFNTPLIWSLGHREIILSLIQHYGRLWEFWRRGRRLR